MNGLAEEAKKSPMMRERILETKPTKDIYLAGGCFCFAETVFVRFYPDVVSLEFLLQMFFKAIDPTSLNKQGHDEGTRYRTGVYYTDPADLPIIEKVFAEEQKNYEQLLTVEKLPLQNFYTAEEYHQDYLDKNPNGYCHLPLELFEFAKKAKDNRRNGEDL